MSERKFDLGSRPDSYFGPKSLDKHLLSKVSGAERRAALERFLAEHPAESAPAYLSQSSLSDSERAAAAAIHPAFMGGEYLAKKDAGEIEIARIEIDSTTFDVTSVFAKKVDGVICYRVVDEYDGQTLTGNETRRSTEPLTLGELEEFFLDAWPLYDVLEMNFENDTDSMLGFFRAKSEFYPDLDRLLRQRVIEQYPCPALDDDED